VRHSCRRPESASLRLTFTRISTGEEPLLLRQKWPLLPWTNCASDLLCNLKKPPEPPLMQRPAAWGGLSAGLSGQQPPEGGSHALTSSRCFACRATRLRATRGGPTEHARTRRSQREASAERTGRLQTANCSASGGPAQSVRCALCGRGLGFARSRNAERACCSWELGWLRARCRFSGSSLRFHLLATLGAFHFAFAFALVCSALTVQGGPKCHMAAPSSRVCAEGRPRSRPPHSATAAPLSPAAPMQPAAAEQGKQRPEGPPLSLPPRQLGANLDQRPSGLHDGRLFLVPTGTGTRQLGARRGAPAASCARGAGRARNSWPSRAASEQLRAALCVALAVWPPAGPSAAANWRPQPINWPVARPLLGRSPSPVNGLSLRASRRGVSPSGGQQCGGATLLAPPGEVGARCACVRGPPRSPVGSGGLRGAETKARC